MSWLDQRLSQVGGGPRAMKEFRDGWKADHGPWVWWWTAFALVMTATYLVLKWR